LDDELRGIFDEWATFMGEEHEEFNVLTKYIGRFLDVPTFGEWVVDTKNDGSSEHPFQMPFVNYSRFASVFEKEFYEFSESHPEYQLTQYSEILSRN
jgi:hypothetical protein